VHGGGTKHVTLKRFEPSSLVHESDSDLRDSLWLSSSRIGCARSAFFYGGQYCHGSFVTGRDDAARGAAPRQ